MKYSSLISTYNLKLAWRRINTGLNLQYKRFFRESYLVYESGINQHLKQLHKDLEAKAWRPTHATRLYVPKPSGLQRPLSLLGIEDQILLQAIANLFAKKLYDKRHSVSLKSVFSNILSKPKGSIFFTDRWQIAYRAFQNSCEKAFNEGYVWAADFDLSAYYDTISHDLLLSNVSSQGGEVEVNNTIKDCLRTWSAEDPSTMKDHGIPQGPLASDFLAEAFFLPVDLILQKAQFRYLRYVDDIRLFGRTEGEVRNAALILEQKCRDRGLIPHSSKYEIRRVRSPAEAMGSLPSIPPTDSRGLTEPPMSAREAIRTIATSIGGRPKKINDKSRFRYVMYRAPANTQLLRTVCMLLPRHPEHIDAFTAYFGNFTKRRSIAREALKYLESGVPYTYVRGELWHVVARLAEREELKRGLPLAKADAKGRSRCIALSWGVMHFLIRCEQEEISRKGRRLFTEHPVSRSLLAPILSARDFVDQNLAAALLTGTIMEQLAGAREMQRRRVTLNSIGLRQSRLSESCQVSLHSFGIIRRARVAYKDYIRDILAKQYNCNHSAIWRLLLVSEYEYALQILTEAQARFNGAYSEWLGLQDSFNDLVTRHFFVFLEQNELDGYSKLYDRKGNAVRYGSLIAEGNPFDRKYTTVASAFRVIHKRRNEIPNSHPYSSKGTGNRFLKRHERDALFPLVTAALDGIANAVDENRFN